MKRNIICKECKAIVDGDNFARRLISDFNKKPPVWDYICKDCYDNDQNQSRLPGWHIKWNEDTI